MVAWGGIESAAEETEEVGTSTMTLLPAHVDVYVGNRADREKDPAKVSAEMNASATGGVPASGRALGYQPEALSVSSVGLPAGGSGAGDRAGGFVQHSIRRRPAFVWVGY